MIYEGAYTGKCYENNPSTRCVLFGPSVEDKFQALYLDPGIMESPFPDHSLEIWNVWKPRRHTHPLFQIDILFSVVHLLKL